MRFLRGLIGSRLIDPIEVFYVKETDTFYPIISKSGCSTVKLNLIRLYQPSFESQFPEIHRIDPADETNGMVTRLYFYSFKKYQAFTKGKRMFMVIRNPFERIYSCYQDVKKSKNIMYEHPSGLTGFFGITSQDSFESFLTKVIRLPDYLSDRHFRGQSYFLSKGVVDGLSKLDIILLENYNDVIKSNAKLNINKKGVSPKVLQLLNTHVKFKKRFAEDINMYFSRKLETTATN
ncbi:sulfotransferase family 2 domain-containing protein [Bizionia sp. KMM 8389]